jgi:hypothetical protein
MRPRVAALRRTAQFKFATAQAMDFHLAPGKFSFADNAETLVIERSPFSEPIFGTQHREPIINFKMRNHNAKSSLLFASKRTIGTVDDSLDDWGIG